MLTFKNISFQYESEDFNIINDLSFQIREVVLVGHVISVGLGLLLALSKRVKEKSTQILLPLMETAEVGFLSQSEENWQENIDWMYQMGLIDDKISPSQVMTKEVTSDLLAS